MPLRVLQLFGDRSAGGAFVRGALWMVLAMAGFAIMVAIVRHMSHETHPFVVAFFRNLFGLLFMVPWLARTNFAGLRTQRIDLHFWRAATGLVAMLAWFWAVAHMPLGEAVALNFTAPLFITMLAVPFLGEKVGVRRISATVIGFVGTLIILRPGAEAIQLPALAVLGGSVCMAGAGIIIKKLSRTETDNAIVTYMVLFLTPMSLLPALLYWVTPTWAGFGWLLVLGGLATASHQCLTRAFRAADASALMPLDYVRLPFVAAIAYVAFGEVPDAWTWLGAAIIAASGLYIAHREVVLGRRRAAPVAVGDGSTGGVPVDERPRRTP